MPCHSSALILIPSLPLYPYSSTPNELFFSHLLEQRIVILHGRIDDKQSTMIVGQLLYLELKDSGKPIKMMINSGGGAVHSALAIHDVMKQISSPVYTSCYGHAESAAAILLSSGEKGYRCASANSRVMIHQPARNENGKMTAANAVNRAVRTGQRVCCTPSKPHHH